MKFKHRAILISTAAIATTILAIKTLPNQPPPPSLTLPTPIVQNENCLAQDVNQIDVLWQHIYHPQRLQIVNKCIVVNGVVFSVIAEADGDYHIRLTPDAPYQNLINPVNISGQKGKLVLEPICQHSVTQADAIDACKGFSFPLQIPKVGDHVKVVGSQVLDNQHGGWAEVHPVLRFERL